MRVEIPQEDIDKLVEVIGEIIAEKIVDDLPEEVRKKDAIATGYMARSFKYRATSKTELEVFNEAPYSAVVEFGCVPHRPPYEAIYNWVLIKKKETGEEAERAAWRIVKKIEKEGYGPRYFTRDYLRRLSRQGITIKVEIV
ncbi:MAG: HK97 gp10 family phage protein [Candidatus Caldarchaeum sp.]